MWKYQKQLWYLVQSSVHYCAPQLRSCYWCGTVQWHNNADDKDSDATVIMQLFIKSPVNGWQNFSGKECRGKKPFKNGVKTFLRERFPSTCTCIFTWFFFNFHTAVQGVRGQSGFFNWALFWAVVWAELWNKRVWADYEQLLRSIF